MSARSIDAPTRPVTVASPSIFELQFMKKVVVLHRPWPVVAPASIRFEPEQHPSRLPVVADLAAGERAVDRNAGIPAKWRKRRGIVEVVVGGAPGGAGVAAEIEAAPVCR